MARHPGVTHPIAPPPPPPHLLLRISLNQAASPQEQRGSVETQVRAALQAGRSGWDGVQGCVERKDRGHPMGCGKGSAVDALEMLGLWGARFPPLHPQLPRGSGAGQDPGLRVPGCRYSPRHVGSPAGGEGGEASARGQERGGHRRTRHVLLETSGLGRRGVTAAHACAHMHMGTHTCTCVFMAMCVSVHASTSGCTPVHMCIYTHICIHTQRGMEICTHM